MARGAGRFAILSVLGAAVLLVLGLAGVKVWQARKRLAIPACRALETTGWRFQVEGVLDPRTELRALQYSRHVGEYTLAAVVFLWGDSTEFDGVQFWLASPQGQGAQSPPDAAVEVLSRAVEHLAPGGAAAVAQAYAALPPGRNEQGQRDRLESTASTPGGWAVTASRETDDEGSPDRVVLVFRLDRS